MKDSMNKERSSSHTYYRSRQYSRGSHHKYNEHDETGLQNPSTDSRIASFSQDKNVSSSRTYMTIKAQNIGRVIGKQGSQIRELESSTGTRIRIGREDVNGNATVTITGTPDSQEKCKEMINKLIGTFTLSLPSNANKSFDDDDDDEKEEEKPFTLIDWDEMNKKALEYEKQRWANCGPLKKDFYFEHPDVTKMSDEYVRNLRKSLNNITVKYAFKGDGKIPNPVENFEQAFFKYPEIMSEIRKQGFDKPFPIQCQTWPILLSGKDMIGIAQTGTGKTLAFLLPALIHTDGQEVPFSERGGPNVLILAPTRELALQIDKEVDKYSYRNIKSICVYGGGNRREQITEVQKGVQIVIATPGRLNDLIQARVIDIESITYLVLDEADRMLDMGFEPQIRKILLDIRPDKQIVMMSATWPFGVQNLAEKYMNNPIHVVVGSLSLAAVHSVTQTILILRDEEKTDVMNEMIDNLSLDDKIIIFVDKKALADALSCDLVLRGIDCQSIHGDREQVDREQAIEDLKNGSVRILVATDVASRGIDITDVTKVLNYDFPRNIEEYVHRVGRTGRAGKDGQAITFFTRGDWAYANELISILEEANQEIPKELYNMRDRFEAAKEKRKLDPKFSRGGRDYHSRGSYDRGYTSNRPKW